jgi:3-oxoacyl-[acyl-carrier protein] reductase
MLITGTRSGIGRFLAHRYAGAGYEVIGCSRTPVDFQLPSYRHFELDVANEKDVRSMFSQIRKDHGRLDVLINNAAIVSRSYMMIASLDTFEEALRTNVVGSFLISRESTKLMKNNSFGRIVNLSSIAVPLASPGTAVYGASKAAMEQFSRVLAQEVAPLGITVNTLGMPFVEGTGMIEEFDDKTISETLERTVLKSNIKLDDVANAIDFFISDASSQVTNQVLHLGGLP